MKTSVPPSTPPKRKFAARKRRVAKEAAAKTEAETLQAWAERYCSERGFDLAFALANGAVIVTAAQAKAQKIFPPGDGILWFYTDVRTDELTETKRLRYRNPPVVDGKEQRHGQPYQNPCECFYPASGNWKAALRDVTIDLHFAEGEADTLGALKHGFLTIGLGGVDSYGGPELMPSLRHFKWKNRHVHLCPDSDMRTKPGVQLAMNKLAAALTARGAIVHPVDIPNVVPGGKTGLGDFLARVDASVFTQLKLGTPIWKAEDAKQTAEYPAPLSKAAHHGLIGEWAALVEPHTEADPAALIVTGLVALGSLIGRGPHVLVENTPHHGNLFAVLSGPTASGRKGTATGRGLGLVEAINPDFVKMQVATGLSSGEGLIHLVRDMRMEKEEAKPPKDADELKKFQKAKLTGPVYVDAVVDFGVDDKRALINESEFSNTLQMAARDGNILSTVMRNAWDSSALRVISRSNKDTCATPHISVIGNITNEELKRRLTENDRSNGFANRVLWVCVRRSKMLPNGGGTVDPANWKELIDRFQKAVAFATKAGQCKRDSTARKKWESVYPELTADEDGIVGTMTARGPAQVVRLSMLYALLDCSTVVRVEHLDAALEVWRYCKDSVRYIFGTASGDATTDAILMMLKAAPDGLTQTAISNGFGRHKTAAELKRALSALQQRGYVTTEQQKGKGAPTTIWRAA